MNNIEPTVEGIKYYLNTVRKAFMIFEVQANSMLDVLEDEATPEADYLFASFPNVWRYGGHVYNLIEKGMETVDYINAEKDVRDKYYHAFDDIKAELQELQQLLQKAFETSEYPESIL